MVRDASAVTGEFEQFAERHRSQWESEGRPGHFHAWPRALEFNRELVKTLAALGRVRFFNLQTQDKVLTSQYAYAFGTRLFAELPARVSGPEWDRFSLGCTSQIKLIESAIGEGFETMESGLGHYEYKLLTGGTELPVQVIHLARQSRLSRFKVAVFRILNRFLGLLLQKGWYRRIMPRLSRAFRTGQSQLLLRLDF